MTDDKVIDILNGLIETCRDAEEGFRTCADGLKNAQLQTTLLDRAQNCQAATQQLQDLVRAQGGEPETGTSTSGKLFRRWVDVKAAITGKDEEAVLNECERGQDVALHNFQHALEKEDLPPTIRDVVEIQYQEMKDNHDKVKALRDAERGR